MDGLPHRILIIEDEVAYRDSLAVLLRLDAYRVEGVSTGREGLHEIRAGRADLVLLDIGLPDCNGFALFHEIREISRVPVIFMTARGEVVDRVTGLELGADDYVTKPYSSRELIARIRAVMRRHQEPETSTGLISAGPVRMDIERHVVSVNNVQVSFPLKEFELLEFLMRNAGRVLTRTQLIDRVWGSDYVGDTKTLDVHIKRLRSKIERDPAEPEYILTVRGLGYKFAN